MDLSFALPFVSALVLVGAASGRAGKLAAPRGRHVHVDEAPGHREGC